MILANNKLVGCLPAEIGNLVNVAVFDIASNSFNGILPRTVKGLGKRTGVSRDKVEMKLNSHVKMEDDTVTLSVMSDDDVESVIIHKEKGSDQAPPASTSKNAIVEDIDSSESIDTSGKYDNSKTNDTEDERGDDDDGKMEMEERIEERGVCGTPNSFSPSMNMRWTVSRSELYSIKLV
ncbi:hypothetical protein Ddye_023173 [Dipteronia dyeriana]|uniref:Uncharacterized protein n=1 Tax=Dipteronia dyeriana TaxID=168575 RepID=A0AAD9TTF8_9ROSI|nr:hypothetical protein Ddye_023173 [Dipteronia dyeriana]